VIYDFPKIAQALIANGANKSAQDIYDLKAADYINPERPSAPQFEYILNPALESVIINHKKQPNADHNPNHPSVIILSF
jgi:hypothetical protein